MKRMFARYRSLPNRMRRRRMASTARESPTTESGSRVGFVPREAIAHPLLLFAAAAGALPGLLPPPASSV